MASPVVGIAKGEAPANDSNTAVSQRLAKSAREFEAILLQDWLEKMNQSFVGVEDSPDAAHDTVSSLGTQAIANAIAQRGGIGIANMILRHLQPGSSAEGKHGEAASPAAANPGLGVADSRAEDRKEKPGANIKVFSRTADH